MSGTGPAPVSVNSVSRRYGDTAALSDISISIKPNMLTGIIGADGAGKTTLMRICATLDNLYSGTVSVLGYSTLKQRQMIRDRIGYMPQRFSLYPDLSVKENIRFFADIFTIPKDRADARIRRLLSFARLESFVDRKAGNLSGGMKQKLALCCALIHEPKVLLLDEPTVGVDPLSREEFWEILYDLRKAGTTIILTTPYMDEAQLCDDLILLHEGKVISTGTPKEMVDRYPLAIYQLDIADRIPSEKTLPPGIVHIYATGGSLRIVTERQLSREDIQTALEQIIPFAAGLKPAPAGIEDVFIHELTSRGTGAY